MHLKISKVNNHIIYKTHYNGFTLESFTCSKETPRLNLDNISNERIVVKNEREISYWI